MRNSAYVVPPMYIVAACKRKNIQKERHRNPRKPQLFPQKVAQQRETSYLCSRSSKSAAIAQLVEHDLAKVGVASSSLVCRSSYKVARMVEW